ncbi:MAG: TPD domain-containing protein [Thermoplasmata archaeon]|nr:TPD domain-containing protein [Thermoplasmata archaeon]
MNTREYKELASKLNYPSDIGMLARDGSIGRELLLIIYTQRVVRDATRRYYQIKNRADKLLWQWKNGTTLVQIARKERFPPVLLSLIVLREYGLSRKEFWSYVRGQSTPRERRLRRDISEVVTEDIIYSPAGMEVQYQRGKKGEARLCEWLDRNRIGYRTEDEIKGEYAKTPDALLDEPTNIDGQKIYWIESKANFGNALEVRRNMKKQLIPYTQLFGPGIVVYWFGFVKDYERVKDVRVVDSRFFRRDLPK